MRGQPLVNGSVTVVMIDLLMRFLEKMKRARTEAKSDSNYLSTVERGEVSPPKTFVVPSVDQGSAIRGECASSIMDEAFLINNAVAYEEGPFHARVTYPNSNTTSDSTRKPAPIHIPEVADVNTKECTGWTVDHTHSFDEWSEVTADSHPNDPQYLRSEGRHPADCQGRYDEHAVFDLHGGSLPRDAPEPERLSVNCLGPVGATPFPHYEPERDTYLSMAARAQS